jgi:hypothetical protein
MAKWMLLRQVPPASDCLFKYYMQNDTGIAQQSDCSVIALHLGYKNQSVKDVKENSGCLF